MMDEDELQNQIFTDEIRIQNEAGQELLLEISSIYEEDIEAFRSTTFLVTPFIEDTETETTETTENMPDYSMLEVEHNLQASDLASISTIIHWSISGKPDSMTSYSIILKSGTFIKKGDSHQYISRDRVKECKVNVTVTSGKLTVSLTNEESRTTLSDTIDANNSPVGDVAYLSGKSPNNNPVPWCLTISAREGDSLYTPILHMQRSGT